MSKSSSVILADPTLADPKKGVMTTYTQVAAAAPIWVKEQLLGPLRDAEVVHTGRHAIYVSIRAGDARRCVGLLSRSSSAVPCGLHTTLPDLSGLVAENGTLVPGDTVTVGEGLLRLGAVDFHVGRTVDRSVPRLNPADAKIMAERLRHVIGDRLAAVETELPAESLALLAQADAVSVLMLLGRGSGLTPVGDDVLAGWLATMKATHSDTGTIAQSVAHLSTDATTLLSSTLLDRANAGDVLPEFRTFLLDLRSSVSGRHGDQLSNSVDRMLAVGHTSGAGLLLGSLLAFDYLSTDQLSTDQLCTDQLKRRNHSS